MPRLLGSQSATVVRQGRCGSDLGGNRALLSDATHEAPKLIEACRRKYPRLGDAISTHIPAAVREQARHLKRARAFTSLQELYLEAILGSLIKRGFMSRKLDVTTGS
jgi:hypothetical protein